MNLNKSALIWGLIFLGLAVWTLIPSAGASKECWLGYYAHCSFAPVSTAILAFFAILNLLKIKKIKIQKDEQN